MTIAAAPPAPSPRVRSTVLDRLTARLNSDPRLARLWRWLAPTIITVIAGVLRLWNLAHPHAFIFDETYYVKDSWTQWNLGYSATWPDGADERFLAGATDIFTTVGSFVVHPPLGKWLIGLGMGVFGPESGFGWRIAVALCGTATVLVLYLVAKTLTGSLVFATVASGLMAIDGLAIVMSRVALLDIFLTFFALLAFWFVLLDRRRHLERVSEAVAARSVDGAPPAWGPVFWNRPWIIAAGAAVGAATAVKWSGLYIAAGLGVYLVVTDALERRRAGVAFWPTDALRQGLVTFVLLIPVAFAVYLSSWIGWLVTAGGYDRDSVPGSPLASLWTYHEAMYGFHIALNSAHGYASPAWQWPLLLRPTSMYFHRDDVGQAGCEIANGCVQNIYSMPNPLIWFAAVAAVIYLLVRFVMTRRWQYAVVLTGVGLTYVPWLLYPERTIFQFYTIAILPFMLLALTFALRDVAGGASDDTYRRVSGQRTVWVFLAVVVLLSAFWYPVLTAMPVPYDFWRLHNWLPTWV